MMKYNYSLLLVLFIYIGNAQETVREYRVLKSQFPEKGIVLAESLKDIKRVKYYKEIDTVETRFAIRFKKDRLFYHIQTNKEGIPFKMGYKIKPIDIPDEAYLLITAEIQQLNKQKIRSIYQYYPIGEQKELDIKNALQNLMLPSLQYVFWVSVKEDKKQDYILRFNNQGKLLSKERALPANYDHVLY